MATPNNPVATTTTTGPHVVVPESPVTVKVVYNDSTRRFKIPLRDLTARVFPLKVCQLLNNVFRLFSLTDNTSSVGTAPPATCHSSGCPGGL